MTHIRNTHCPDCGALLTAANAGRRYGFRCQAHEDKAYAEGERHLAEVARHLARAGKGRVPSRRRALLNAAVPGEAIDTKED